MSLRGSLRGWSRSQPSGLLPQSSATTAQPGTQDCGRLSAARQLLLEQAGHELCTALASLRVCLDLGPDAARARARAAVRDGLIDVERLTSLVQAVIADLGEHGERHLLHDQIGELSGQRPRCLPWMPACPLVEGEP